MFVFYLQQGFQLPGRDEAIPAVVDLEAAVERRLPVEADEIAIEDLVDARALIGQFEERCARVPGGSANGLDVAAFNGRAAFPDPLLSTCHRLARANEP